jgi:hypothetical protein
LWSGISQSKTGEPESPPVGLYTVRRLEANVE